MTIQEHRSDIQALVGTGFGGLRHGEYHLLRLQPGRRQGATAWLRAALSRRLVKSCAELRGGSAGVGGIGDEAVSLAFTFRGLVALGLAEREDAPFPTPFKSGMASPLRARLLGDHNRDRWTWGDTATPGAALQPVDLLVAHYRRQAGTAQGELLSRTALQAGGWDVVDTIVACADFISEAGPGGAPRFTEPFGFRDGLAQPVPRGLREPGPREKKPPAPEPDYSSDNDIEPGEFVLGHRNEYGELAHCPDVQGWREPPRAPAPHRHFGLNGSYLVVRQILQDVAAFRAFEAGHPAPADGGPSLAELMVGRRKDGTPLATCPYRPGRLNNFRYRVDDFNGLMCPRGAHIRRSNPRDMLAWDVESGVRASKLHRLLRRGRVYTRGAMPQPEEQGLFFMALNANLDRQFEFVQQRWITDNTFGDLRSEDDPIVGNAPQRFTTPGLPVGRMVKDFAQFTHLRGGGYFFLPGLAALWFIADEARGG